MKKMTEEKEFEAIITNQFQSSNERDIKSTSAQNMVRQIRIQQLETKKIQNKLRKNIEDYAEKHEDITSTEMYNTIAKGVQNQIALYDKTNNLIAKGKVTANDVGIPIQYNKTCRQLALLQKYIASFIENGNEDNFIPKIIKGSFYNGLSNYVTSLPKLGAPSKADFWGNQNPSESSMMLYNAAKSLEIKITEGNLGGNIRFYPFFDKGYVNEEIKDSWYVFQKEKFSNTYQSGMMLFGNYQYGGHRYFKEHGAPFYSEKSDILFPEDCSSAVGKATGLSIDQITAFSVGSIIKAYETNNYGYQAITCQNPSYTIDFDQISNGDILCYRKKGIGQGGHAAIVSKIDKSGNIQTYDFNRNIDNGEIEGGGYDCRSLAELTEKNDVYILRSDQKEFKESIRESDLLSQIDNGWYSELNVTEDSETQEHNFY
jgi:hypothetical protein